MLGDKLEEHPDVARLVAKDGPSVLATAAIVGRAVIARTGGIAVVGDASLPASCAGAPPAPAPVVGNRHLEISELRLVRVGKPVITIAGSMQLSVQVRREALHQNQRCRLVELIHRKKPIWRPKYWCTPALQAEPPSNK